MALPLERIEGKYDIVAKLREGGMGAVYKVRHRLLDELRVVKVLRTQLAGDAELEARFVREARAAIRLRHPNVVQIFDFSVDDDGHGFIVMEYIRGVDLQQLVASGKPLPVPLVLEIGRQALRALAYLHRRGFVHRDISPDNLMLTRDVDERPLVKMIDLGIAKEREAQSQLTATGVFLGKFRYSSPEHFGAGETADVDERSDVYSFGVVLYELLTLRFPILGTGSSQLIAGHLFRPPVPFAETDPDGRVPETLRRTVMRCLAKSPDDRYATAAELYGEIEELQERHPLSEMELALARRLTSGAREEPAATPGGSTQSRLDAGFQVEPTPPPTATTPLPLPPRPRPRPAPTAPAAPVPSPLDRHLEAACALAERGDDEAAVRELEAARELQPRNGMVAQLLREARERLAEKREEAAVAAVVDEIEAHLAAGRRMDADRVLFQAGERHGPHPRLLALRSRLDAAHHRELEDEVRRLVGEAEAARAEGRAARAVELFNKARAVAPGYSALVEEMRRIEPTLRAPAPDGPLRDAALVAEARAARERGDLLRARLLLSDLLSREPRHPDARALADELDGRRRPPPA